MDTSQLIAFDRIVREGNFSRAAQALDISQPTSSHHLRVLRDVGLVSARSVGCRQVYRVNGERLKPIHDWTKTFERFWDEQLKRIKERAERKAKGEG